MCVNKYCNVLYIMRINKNIQIDRKGMTRVITIIPKLNIYRYNICVYGVYIFIHITKNKAGTVRIDYKTNNT